MVLINCCFCNKEVEAKHEYSLEVCPECGNHCSASEQREATQ